MDIKEKIRKLPGDLKQYWKHPPQGRYMPFKEIAAYSVGGLGAYLIMTLGGACILGTGNTLISSTLGVDATDMYILYVIAVLVNIPLTGVRAHIIDNTRNKAGKYRPYIVSMGIPTAVLCTLMVWFPYDKFGALFGDGLLFGETRAYIAKCAVILLLNLGIQFVYYFFYDGYENLIHVLSPNTQERADVSAIKSVVYSAAPSIVNLITPIIASKLFHTNTTDIRVYRLLYPILGVLGILLCIVVYKNTEEKIIRARTHVVRVRFIDALRAVAKNKYFWIISFAGWIGFLETAYINIFTWLYNYGGVCSGSVYGIIITIYGNASLWGMILAPFWIKRSGKKRVLVITNIFNIIFILMLLPVTQSLNNSTIWLVLIFLYLNAFMGSFALILNPAIQADIRDYQQYITGERIDGMFSAVGTIGTVITLATSSILPIIYEREGVNKAVASQVTSNPEILNRMLGDGKTVGQILSEQLTNGQDSYHNAFSALYDPDILLRLLHVLILMSALGALLNVIPFFWYDFSERKQKSIVQTLKVRAMFEDHGNGALTDEALLEAYPIIEAAYAHEKAQPKVLDKSSIRSAPAGERKAARQAYREAKQFNEDLHIHAFIRDELRRFEDPVEQYRIAVAEKRVQDGLSALHEITDAQASEMLLHARAMPKGSSTEKRIRTYAIEDAKAVRRSVRICAKMRAAGKSLVEPDITKLEDALNTQDALDDEIRSAYEALKRKDTPKTGRNALREQINTANKNKKQAQREEKQLSDAFAAFDRAAKPYLDAEKLVRLRDSYLNLNVIAERYQALITQKNTKV